MELPLGVEGWYLFRSRRGQPIRNERIIDTYTQGISPVIGEYGYSPDINTTAQMMDWMVNAYRDSTGSRQKCCNW